MLLDANRIRDPADKPPNHQAKAPELLQLHFCLGLLLSQPGELRLRLQTQITLGLLRR